MIGWIGLGLLVSAYMILETRLKSFFIPVDAVASLVLTIHALMIDDIVFLLVNGWITIILAYKWYQREFEV